MENFKISGLTGLAELSNDIPIQYQNTGMLTHGLQNIIQYQVIKHLSTGDFFIDAILQIIVIGIITFCITQLKEISNSIYTSIKQFGNYLFRKIIGLFKQNKIIKTSEIPYITEQRHVNELYKAVQWYLSTNNDIDYTKDSEIQYVFDKQIIPENKELLKEINIGKVLKNNNKKEIIYKGYIIKYLFNTEIITIYTDREKKRENQIIKLSVEIDNKCKNDILEEFCSMCVTKFLESQIGTTWKQQIYMNNENKWKSEPSNITRGLNSVILQNDIKKTICDDLNMFLNSEDWYLQRDIPYTRGYLFYGPPGTGKTSLIKSLSLTYKRHLYYLMLQNIESDTELFELFKSINFKDSIVVIEDIDLTIEAVKSRELLQKEKEKEENEKEVPNYKSRDITFQHHLDTNNNINNNIHNNNINEKIKKKEITLSGLLNVFDGMVNCHGRIVIMTSNKPQFLDEALIRSGRCDMKILLDNCDKKQIAELYEMFFNKMANNNHLGKINAKNYSPAHISSIFLRYRNNPDNALLHLDDTESKIVI